MTTSDVVGLLRWCSSARTAMQSATSVDGGSPEYSGRLLSHTAHKQIYDGIGRIADQLAELIPRQDVKALENEDAE